MDLLSAIAKYAPDNPFIAIFGCILSGSLDPIMFRYHAIITTINAVLYWGPQVMHY